MKQQIVCGEREDEPAPKKHKRKHLTVDAVSLASRRGLCEEEEGRVCTLWIEALATLFPDQV